MATTSSFLIDPAEFIDDVFEEEGDLYYDHEAATASPPPVHAPSSTSSSSSTAASSNPIIATAGGAGGDATNNDNTTGNADGGSTGTGSSDSPPAQWPGGRRSYCVWRFISWGFIAYLGTMATALVVAMIANKGNSCGRPLTMWASLEATVFYLQMFKGLWLHFRLPIYVSTERDTMSNFRKAEVAVVYVANRLLNLFWFIWFFFGSVYVFDERDCASEAPILWKTCFVEVIIQLVLIGLVVAVVVIGIIVLSIMYMIDPTLLGLDKPRGASKRLINRKTTKAVFNPDKTSLAADDRFCAICLSEYNDGDEIRILPCKHHYHAECVESWLVTNKSCASCRRPIDAAEAAEITGNAPEGDEEAEMADLEEQLSQQEIEAMVGGGAPNGAALDDDEVSLLVRARV